MEPQLTLVESFEEVCDFFSWLGNRRQFLGFDVETAGLDWHRDELRTVQFGDASHGWCFAWDAWGKGVAQEVFARYDGEYVGHNVKFDMLYARVNGIEAPRARMHDSLAMAHLVDSSKSVALKNLAVRYVEPGADSADKELKAAMLRNRWTWATVPVNFQPYWAYAALDTMLTVQLAELLYPAVRERFAAVYDLELASSHVLQDMEWYGTRVDAGYASATARVWRDAAEHLRRELTDQYGLENPDADRQVEQALLREGVRLTKLTKGGQFSVDKDVLATIDHPLAAEIRRYRRLTKWCSTYFESVVDLRDVNDLVHANVKALGARTGRMSCSRPNLQNLPRDAAVRDSFIARDGHTLVIADFAQIEMRLMAHFAHETTMLDAFRAGVDMHTFVAQQAYGTKEPTRQMRQVAKNAAFAKIYGAGVEKFAITAGISMSDAGVFLQRYDARFPRVRALMQEVTSKVRERAGSDRVGWVRAPSGRVHRVPADQAYKGVNYLIQGTAADVMKEALIKLDLAGLAKYAAVPVHDEIVIDAPVEEAAEIAREVQRVMANTTDFAVELPVEAETYVRWGDKYRDE